MLKEFWKVVEIITPASSQRRVAYPRLKARKARCLRNTELRAMQRKQGWKLDGSGFWNKNKQQKQLFMRYHHSQPKTGLKKKKP